MADLQTLWYLVIGVAVFMYAVLDGFDLGVGALHLFARTDQERRIFLNAIGPVWDGNEVWIVIVMGGLFAGFPNAYATVFSGFYTLMMFLIAGLIFRAAAIEFRSKREERVWRSFWDCIFSISSILVGLVLGLFIGNLVEGLYIDRNEDFVMSFADFFRPYSIVVAITSMSLFAMHGTIYLAMKTEKEAHETVHRWIGKAVAFFLIWYVILTVSTFVYKPHMLQRFEDHPTFSILPILSLTALGMIVYFVRKKMHGLAFIFSSLTIACLLGLYCVGTYPTIVYSLLNPDTNSLTIYNASSSEKTLGILLIVVAIGVPLVLAYGFWVYRIFRGKVQLNDMSY